MVIEINGARYRLIDNKKIGYSVRKMEVKPRGRNQDKENGKRDKENNSKIRGNYYKTRGKRARRVKGSQTGGTRARQE